MTIPNEIQSLIQQLNQNSRGIIMKQLPDKNRQKEIIKEIEIAEQKARNMADFATLIAKKWESHLMQRNQEEKIKS